MLLIIIGAFVLVRFIGQLMNAKRGMEEERDMHEQQRKFEEEKRRAQSNIGKTKILKKSEGTAAEDVDFEELD